MPENMTCCGPHGEAVLEIYSILNPSNYISYKYSVTYRGECTLSLSLISAAKFQGT